MNPDIACWNDKYRRAAASAFADPEPLLVSRRDLVTGSGRALDVACGAGANAIFAAGCGLRVVGMDASLEGLRIAARRAREASVHIALVNVDLEVYRPPPGRFDLVLVIRYLNRNLFPALEETLRPGGLLMYLTFNRNYLEEKPGFNPAYLLAPGELKERFANLELIDGNDDENNGEFCSYLIGRKPAP